ncbi:MAG: lysophospholipid acyltransferase family protein [Pseudomonadota bacterium]
MSDANSNLEPDAADPSPKVLGRGDPGWTDATWNGATPPQLPDKTLLQKLRGVLRLLCFVLATLALLPVYFIARLMGHGPNRYVAGLWCGVGAFLCGLRLRRLGQPIRTSGVIVANHATWIDILTIGPSAPVHFVAKAEVSSWPFFGWIGKISDTVFIERRRTEAKAQERHLIDRALDGDLLCLFPEGTSSDGMRVLPFKSSLFSMFYATDRSATELLVQPLSIHYAPAPNSNLPSNFYGWWGRMPLFKQIWDVTCLSSAGIATLEFHDPLRPGDFENRKSLASAAQESVALGRERAAIDAQLARSRATN